MKKVFFFMALAVTGLTLTACGGNDKNEEQTPASEAQAIAKKMCDCQKMSDSDEMTKCMKEAQSMYEKAYAKYKDDEKKLKEFNEAGEKAARECMGISNESHETMSYDSDMSDDYEDAYNNAMDEYEDAYNRAKNEYEDAYNKAMSDYEDAYNKAAREIEDMDIDF